MRTIQLKDILLPGDSVAPTASDTLNGRTLGSVSVAQLMMIGPSGHSDPVGVISIPEVSFADEEE